MADKQIFAYFVSYMFQTNNFNGDNKRGHGDTHVRLDTDKPGIAQVHQMRQHVCALLCRDLNCSADVSVTILSFQRLPGEDGVEKSDRHVANTLLMRRVK